MLGSRPHRMRYEGKRRGGNDWPGYRQASGWSTTPQTRAARANPPNHRASPPPRGPPHWEQHIDPRELDALAMSEPVPTYEFDQRVSW